VCIIPFTQKFLLEYTAMPPTPLEIVESIDMLRILENGIKLKMIPTDYTTHAVDTLADLQKTEMFMSLESNE
jgi:3-deoxy-manno-octulosonate cytidylyltransferase (CMP-KDO synthetase)